MSKMFMNQKRAGLMLSALLLLLESGCAVKGNAESLPRKEEKAVKAADISVEQMKQHDTVYAIGSVSKVYATVTVLQLVDQGKVDLDGPVTDYIPEFTMADERYRDITVRMLMDHTSGIPGTVYSDSFLIGDNDQEGYEERFLQILSTQTLRDEPGHSTAYCNDGFGLLEIITERVSGMTFTEYLRKNVSDPLGADDEGTPIDFFEHPDRTPTYDSYGTPIETDYCLNIGGGGIMASAPSLSTFGTGFFKNNDTLLTQKSKALMATRAMSDPYMDGCGLGWDLVSIPRYEEVGVQVVVKGGDLFFQHASLVVAPEEEISVAVVSSGGNSFFNQMMAQSLMDIALEEKGISVSDSLPAEKETLDTIPESVLKYAGLYTSGTGLTEISFPGGKYAKVRTVSGKQTDASDYLYCTDGTFVKMTGLVDSGKAYQGSDQTLLRFEEKDGTVYVVESTDAEITDLGRYSSESYSMQRLDLNPVSSEAQAAWRGRNEDEMILVSEGASSAVYEAMGIGKITSVEELPGYVSVMGRLLRIKDADHAEAFITIPSSSGRDQLDLRVEHKNGADYYVTSQGLTFLSGKNASLLTKDSSPLTLSENEANVYRIGEDYANTQVRMEGSGDLAVFSYDRFGNMVYTSHYTEFGGDIPLPKEGYLIIRSEKGGEVTPVLL
ncbi:MAG: beta-lactamase family protein [Lachnospiraceae bacterium]|nr:beta-lactamase family protein [Lachnospiraceae bacterium]